VANIGFLTAATALSVIKSTYKFMHIKLCVNMLTKILSDSTALEIKL